MKRKAWTKDEDAIIRAHYGTGEIAAWCHHLPGRAENAVRQHCFKMGLVVARRWTAAEKKRLVFLWGHASMDEMVAQLPGREPNGISAAAVKLGLTGVPRGYETMKAAAERTGFSRPYLRRILIWAHVPMHANLCPRPENRNRPHHIRRFVEPEAVDEAVVAWLATEEIATAARTRDLHISTIRRLLRNAGFDMALHGRAPRRFATKDIDRVVAAYRAPPVTEALKQGAARWGISHERLRQWLADIGIATTLRPRLAPADTDRAIVTAVRRGAQRLPKSVRDRVAEMQSEAAE